MKKFLLLLVAIFAVALYGANGKIRVYVTRHGQPGKGGTVVPLHKGDPALTAIGQAQSHDLGKFLKSQGFKGRIFASPYLRTVDTAAGIAAECGLKVRPDARFQERAGKAGRPNMSRGYSTAELMQLFPGLIDETAVLAEKWLLVPDKPEGYREEQKDRLMKGLDEVMKEFPGEDLLFAIHSGGLTGFKVGFEERMGGKKCKAGSNWNCALLAWDIDTKTGEVTYVGYRIDYMPLERITSNSHKVKPEKPKKDHKPDWTK